LSIIYHSVKIENNENVYSIFNRISILYHSVFSNRKRNEERRTSGIRKNYRNPNNRCGGSENRAKAFRRIGNQSTQTRR
jgi:hypothetical protein